jgi:hypothetical protein
LPMELSQYLWSWGLELGPFQDCFGYSASLKFTYEF